ncbi:ribosomal-protein-alanine N-acetyltransferase [Desulfuromusa kysingii]|uniref:[Ribosomal protein bS18]-alanine N-acetyltransferase n=1 Tax=Desulfuromusa kysingii TaxID=37625 RepID=A0A1H4CZW5_9BACT|nr:ribosomal protein S18-alanine N-acetyltransferase [Desulfuromusa kysingii]SEA65612.1 ribosomal-protein-alanine N-acetyltransferase [Desulfuromusa kysingii]
MAIKSHVIRLISAADLDAVLLVEKDCYSHPWSQRQFEQELENPVASILVYEVAGEIAGFICYWLVVDEMQILNLATASNYRRQGFALLLLQEALARCAKVGLASAWLEVRSGNDSAIALYQRCGFELNSMRKSYYRDGEDALVMVKTF